MTHGDVQTRVKNDYFGHVQQNSVYQMEDGLGRSQILDPDRFRAVKALQRFTQAVEIPGIFAAELVIHSKKKLDEQR